MRWHPGPMANGQSSKVSRGALDEMAALRWSVETFEFEVDAFRTQAETAWTSLDPSPVPRIYPPASSPEVWEPPLPF